MFGGVPEWELLGYTPGSFLKSVKQKELEDTELGRRYGKRKIRQKAEGRIQKKSRKRNQHREHRGRKHPDRVGAGAGHGEVRRNSQFGEDGVEATRLMLIHISYSVKSF